MPNVQKSQFSLGLWSVNSSTVSFMHTNNTEKLSLTRKKYFPLPKARDILNISHLVVATASQKDKKGTVSTVCCYCFSLLPVTTMLKISFYG